MARPRDLHKGSPKRGAWLVDEVLLAVLLAYLGAGMVVECLQPVPTQDSSSRAPAGSQSTPGGAGTQFPANLVRMCIDSQTKEPQFLTADPEYGVTVDTDNVRRIYGIMRTPQEYHVALSRGMADYAMPWLCPS
ncbi:uncharacterized protein B0I36DRAFT_347686 [Microdochium trichocladiopsis]|uniref:Uncharacterized protein n=1 Tax=Microdochium trichocladiopsis TaxID=1682393 RepID=A0A9P8YDE4_9PEZI|nr:uncharacterized protein B0I36DRAFT_347686 [Microdochium trichocladiopsis]KAH7035979.1 hypothetical protein B0I36DRAFT_347686 [Microdochium trichocladiopsis]